MELHELHEFQQDFKKLILSGEAPERLSKSLASAGDVPAVSRLNIHKNNYRESLSDNLASLFPALEAYVGTDFVRGALKEFCTANPPVSASLANYGFEFSEFLSNHMISEQIPYISDIVRLEWAMHELQIVPEITYEIEPSDVRGCAVSDNVRAVDSDFPLMSIWSAAMGHIPAESVDLNQDGQMVMVLLKDAEVCLMPLENHEALFMRSLQVGADGVFEDEKAMAEAIQSLLEKQILVAV